MRDAVKAGYPFTVLDGTLIRTDRVAADRPFFSGKHHCHGINLQVISGPAGQLLWVSGALPGSVHDMKATWIWGIADELAAADLPALADKGYQGAAHARTPYKGKENRNPRKKPTAPIRNSAHPGKEQAPNSRHGRSRPGYAAAPGGQARSPKPSSSFRLTRPKQDEKPQSWRGRGGGRDAR